MPDAYLVGRSQSQRQGTELNICGVAADYKAFSAMHYRLKYLAIFS